MKKKRRTGQLSLSEEDKKEIFIKLLETNICMDPQDKHSNGTGY
jgi:hypothetical protein